MTAVQKFENITKYDLTKYFNDYINFVNNNQQDIYNYYIGVLQPVQISFNELYRLQKEATRLNQIVISKCNQFLTYDFWDLIDQIDNIRVKLDTVYNYDKWLRSSITKGNYNRNIELTFVLRQNQSLENFSNEVGMKSPDNDWVNVAFKNDLREEDYDFNGGNIFKFNFDLGSNSNFNINSVIDNISSDTIYGKDLNKKIQFVNDDLLALSNNDTMVQNVNVLVSLVKGDNIEFPNDGVDKSLLSNKNKILSIYPSIFRQIYNTFAKDDTLKSITITDVYFNQTSLNMKIQVETRLSEIITTIL